MTEIESVPLNSMPNGMHESHTDRLEEELFAALSEIEQPGEPQPIRGERESDDPWFPSNSKNAGPGWHVGAGLELGTVPQAVKLPRHERLAAPPKPQGVLGIKDTGSVYEEMRARATSLEEPLHLRAQFESEPDWVGEVEEPINPQQAYINAMSMACNRMHRQNEKWDIDIGLDERMPNPDRHVQGCYTDRPSDIVVPTTEPRRYQNVESPHMAPSTRYWGGAAYVHSDTSFYRTPLRTIYEELPEYEHNRERHPNQQLKWGGCPQMRTRTDGSWDVRASREPSHELTLPSAPGVKPEGFFQNERPEPLQLRMPGKQHSGHPGLAMDGGIGTQHLLSRDRSRLVTREGNMDRLHEPVPQHQHAFQGMEFMNKGRDPMQMCCDPETLLGSMKGNPYTLLPVHSL